MPIGELTVTIQTKVAWWVIPFVQCASLVSEMLRLDLDEDKVLAFAMRGVKFEMIDHD
ncbi:hypothetical protein D9M70_497860 [compost metagenome]